MTTMQSEQGATPGVPVEVVREMLHDLGSPLVAALGFLGLLERAPTEESARRYREALREAIETMRDQLERARVVCGKTAPR